MIDAVRDTIRRHAMLAGGEAVLVAVSGGADSVALLYALQALGAELRLTLSVVHLDHGLRAESADDGAFVEALARARSLPVSVERITVAPGGSLEARAREARYAALRRHAARVGAERVALGHTADDQAETVLMRLIEGAGPRGLRGIPPVRGIFIRPLIETRRAEIVDALQRAGLAWREDPSNRDPKLLRNRIRHELLPQLAASYNPAIVAALNRAAALTRDLLAHLTAQAAPRETRSPCRSRGSARCRRSSQPRFCAWRRSDWAAWRRSARGRTGDSAVSCGIPRPAARSPSAASRSR
ncbi:MAG: tRNA lysidine(34) synthetase TilS [Candidatus Rokuibacteriota bacterium]|nr:MAG: tRNA lysidine(34) synthetase TilS [Candidatus Rokubacteria bacterium]